MPEFIIGAKRRNQKPPFYTPILPGTSPLTHRLKAAYLFNENRGTVANDATHSAQHAAIVGGGGWLDNPPTGLGPTVNFDGNTYVQSPQGIYLSGPGHSVSCRMTINSLIALAANNWLWALFQPGPALRSYVEITNTSNMTFSLGGGQTASQAVSANTMYDVVAASNGTTMFLYLNGVLVTSKANANPITAGLYSLWIGSRNLKDGSNNNWGGSIDAVYLWDRALDASEVATLWKAPFAPIPATNGLRKLYPGNASRTGAAATAYTMAGPTVGGIGVVSPPFTVQTVPAFGTITGTCTITPSDGGALGTFTPTSVAVTTAAPNATFTYTPAVGPSVTISVTNNKGLTDPASIVMSVPAYVPPMGTIAMTNTNLVFSPYCWRSAGGSPPAMVTNNPGAYLDFLVTGTFNLALQYDTAAQVAAGVAAADYPVIGVSIDNGPITQFQLSTANVQSLGHFLANTTHYVRIWHLKSSQNYNRWGTVSTDPATQVKLTNILVDSGATTLAWPLTKPNTAIIFGTSITEGVQTFAGNGTLFDNDATWAWSAICADALQCEHGQLGFGGSALQQPNANAIPALYYLSDGSYSGTYNHNSPVPSVPAANYDFQHSRLVAGKFSPMPTYVIVEHGTNDLGRPINYNLYDPLSNTGATGLWPYLRTLVNANVWLIHIIPFCDADRSAIQTAATAYALVDAYFRVIDPGLDLSGGLGAGVSGLPYPNPAPSYLSFGNVHPTLYGSAKAGARVAAFIIAATAQGAGSHSHPIPRGR